MFGVDLADAHAEGEFFLHFRVRQVQFSTAVQAFDNFAVFAVSCLVAKTD
jgi:hypothetical protein